MIIGLACVWYFTAEGTEDPGWLGPHFTEEADPGTTDFVPRPDWFFYFLFYLLRIFKWPDTVVLGTVGVPNILLAILIALPVHRPSPRAAALAAAGGDRRRDHRRPRDGHADIQGRDGQGGARLGAEGSPCRSGPRRRASRTIADAVAGAEIFAQVGCGQCHTYLGSGSSNLGAPDLSDIGASGRSAEYFAQYVANPAQFGNNVMPPFAGLGEENLAQARRLPRRLQGPEGVVP